MVRRSSGVSPDTFNLKSGQRLFSPDHGRRKLGALAGAKAAHLAVAKLTPEGLMLALPPRCSSRSPFQGRLRLPRPKGRAR